MSQAQSSSSAIQFWLEVRLAPEAETLLGRETQIIGPWKGPVGPDLMAEIESANAAIIGARVKWDTALFTRASRLKALSRPGIGYDNVSIADATACGVCVLNTPEAPTESTAEFTIGLMLNLARKLGLAERRFRLEGWVGETEFIGVDLAGRTLGLVGLGRIGARVATIARALGMRVIAYDPAVPSEIVALRGAEPVPDLPALLLASDVVSLHIPLNAKTRGLIGPREFALMKPGAMLINAARGPIVVEEALLAALKGGRLRGAAIDVWEEEPTRPDNPLLKMDNLVPTPHIAAATIEGRLRSHMTAAESALMVLRGERPENLVNPEVWNRRRS